MQNQNYDYELNFLKQLSTGGVIFKPMDPPVSKKRKREEMIQLDKEAEENDAKRTKNDDNPLMEVVKQNESDLDPVTEALDACDFRDNSPLIKPPVSSLVPIARPETTVNFNAIIVKSPPQLQSTSASDTSSCSMAKKSKKTVVSRNSKKSEDGKKASKKKSQAEEDAEIEKCIDEAFARSSARGPYKKACFYELQGLEYSSCEESDDEEDESRKNNSPQKSMMDDMYSMDTSTVPDRVPVVKMVKKKNVKKSLTHNDYVKIDAECVFCNPIKVNKTFDQRMAAAHMALTDSGRKASISAKQAHNLYKEGYNSLTASEIQQFNVPMMSSRHMLRHIGVHSTDPDSTSRRVADRHESDIDELQQYKIVKTDSGPMPNVRLIEVLVKLGKEVTGIRTKLYTRRITKM